MGRRPMGRKTSIESVLYPQGAAIYERLGIGTRTHNSGPAAASSRLLGLAQTAINRVFSCCCFRRTSRTTAGGDASPTLRAFVAKKARWSAIRSVDRWVEWAAERAVASSSAAKSAAQRGLLNMVCCFALCERARQTESRDLGIEDGRGRARVLAFFGW